MKPFFCSSFIIFQAKSYAITGLGTKTFFALHIVLCSHSRLYCCNHKCGHTVEHDRTGNIFALQSMRLIDRFLLMLILSIMNYFGL
jgi:hypothetical protein